MIKSQGKLELPEIKKYIFNLKHYGQVNEQTGTKELERGTNDTWNSA